MRDMLENMEEILDQHISGFRQYVLQEPIHLAFASQNLCTLLGCAKEDLCCEQLDGYAAFVHPADRGLYADFLHRLAREEQTASVQYRITPREGAVKFVSDTAVSKRLDDGTLAAYSTLTDITPLKTENRNLRFLNETIPCGFIRCTCEKQPKITYINEKMMHILRMSEGIDGEPNDLDLYRDNIFLLIPRDERRRFSHFLEQVNVQGNTIGGELTLLRCDGTKCRVYGWVTKSINEQGREEFQSVCMDVTERHQTKKAQTTDRYLQALSNVYDKIFEFDMEHLTVKCLYGERSDMFRWIQNIPMHITEATEHWLQDAVADEDREKVGKFFRAFGNKELQSSQPLQVKYRAKSSNGSVKTYAGIVLKIDPAVSLYCCRSVSDETPLSAEPISAETQFNRQEMLKQLEDGIVAFEVENDRVTPLFTSENVCQFFGCSKEEWMSMAREKVTLREFVSHSGIDYEAFRKLFEQGEAEFPYLDVSTQTRQYVKAVCTRKFADRASPCYVMLYNVNDHMLQTAQNTAGKIRTYIRTFGYFDVFVDEKPIPFRNKKSKELLALLVDRRGGYVTSEEAISFLWEDEEVNAVTLSRYRKVALRLKNTLEEYGIAHVMETVDGKRRIVAGEVRCDLYDYLSQKEEYSQLFKGSYLTNYSWGETTLGELLNKY